MIWQGSWQWNPFSNDAFVIIIIGTCHISALRRDIIGVRHVVQHAMPQHAKSHSENNTLIAPQSVS